MPSYDRHSRNSPPRLGTGGLPSQLTVDQASHSSQHHSLSSRGAMASVNAWRDQQANMSSMNNTGNSSNMSFLDHEAGGDNRILDDSASSDGGIGSGKKRSHGDSQGEDSRDEPRRKRLVTTPHQVAVLSEELRRNPFPSAERRDELAKELGMEPRRVQVWFQNRRQAERLARGRPPYNMMFGNPWYPSYPYTGYIPGPYPPMGLAGDPSMDILIPYGPRRPSLMPHSLHGDPFARGDMPPSYAMGGPLTPEAFGHSGPPSTFHRGDDFAAPTRRPPPTSLAEDLAALEGNGRPSRHTGVSEGYEGKESRAYTAERDETMKASSRSRLQPLQSISTENSLPPPSSLNHASGLPSLTHGPDDTFRLPLPKMSSRHRSITGMDVAPTSSLGASPFDPSRTLAPPRPHSDRDRSTPGHSGSKLPSLSQALEMHPELSPDPTSFRYPPGYEQTLLEGGLGLPSARGSLRRRSSLSRMNESTTSNESSRSLGEGGRGSALLGNGRSNRLGPLPPFPSIDTGRSVPGELFRSPAVRPIQGSASRPLMGPPSSSLSSSSSAALQQQQQRSIRHMPSDASMHTSLRRQSLRDSEMARDAHPQYGRYGL